jgi:hypothetical protein
MKALPGIIQSDESPHWSARGHLGGIARLISGVQDSKTNPTK